MTHSIKTIRASPHDDHQHYGRGAEAAEMDIRRACPNGNRREHGGAAPSSRAARSHHPHCASSSRFRRRLRRQSEFRLGDGGRIPLCAERTHGHQDDALPHGGLDDSRHRARAALRNVQDEQHALLCVARGPLPLVLPLDPASRAAPLLVQLCRPLSDARDPGRLVGRDQ